MCFPKIHKIQFVELKHGFKKLKNKCGEQNHKKAKNAQHSDLCACHEATYLALRFLVTDAK